VLLTISFASIIVGLHRSCSTKNDDNDPGWHIAKFGFLIFILIGFLLVITPNTKSAVAVIAGHTVLEVSSGDKARSIASKSYEVLDKFLNDQLHDNKD
jgi:hypothetical protein